MNLPLQSIVIGSPHLQLRCYLNSNKEITRYPKDQAFQRLPLGVSVKYYTNISFAVHQMISLFNLGAPNWRRVTRYSGNKHIVIS